MNALELQGQSTIRAALPRTLDSTSARRHHLNGLIGENGTIRFILAPYGAAGRRA